VAKKSGRGVARDGTELYSIYFGVEKSPVANAISRLLHLTVPFGSDMIRDG